MTTQDETQTRTSARKEKGNADKETMHVRNISEGKVNELRVKLDDLSMDDINKK